MKWEKLWQGVLVHPQEGDAQWEEIALSV